MRLLYYIVSRSAALPNQQKVDPREARKKVKFGTTIENVELVHGSIGDVPNTHALARSKQDKEAEERGK